MNENEHFTAGNISHSPFKNNSLSSFGINGVNSMVFLTKLILPNQINNFTKNTGKQISHINLRLLRI